MIVIPAAGIEARVACRADRTTLQVLVYCQFFTAGTAQDSFLGKLTMLPNLGRVAGFGLMAMVTSIISLAAFEFDGDNVKVAAIMGTASA